MESRPLRKPALCLELSFHVGNAILGICLGRDRWLRGQLKYRCVLTLAEVQKVARFRQVNLDQPTAHHDALEFPGGKIALVTDLCEDQHATVLQLPAQSTIATEANAEKRIAYVE